MRGLRADSLARGSRAISTTSRFFLQIIACQIFRQFQRRATVHIACVEVGPLVDQELHDLQLIFLDGEM